MITDTPWPSCKSRYWDHVVNAFNEQHRDALWRAHSDIVNTLLLERWLPPGRLRNVLKTDLFDEAVAEGLYPALRRKFQSITGIDVSQRVVSVARCHCPLLRAIVTDARQLPFADGEFDAAVSISTLDHFESRDEIRAALAELHRVIAPGGTLIITLDNGSNPIIALRNRLPYPPLHRLGLMPYRVGVTCTATQLMELLHSCGFELVDISFTVHCPRVIAVLAARIVQRSGNLSIRYRFLRLLASAERLNRSPIRALTGYYVAALARRR